MIGPAPAPRVNRAQRPTSQWVLLIVSVVVIVLSLVAVIVVNPWSSSDNTTLGDQEPVTDETLASAYNYDLVKYPNVASDQTFHFPMVESFDFNKCKETTCWDYFQVYADAALTRELDFTALASRDEETSRPDGVVIAPPSLGIKASLACQVGQNGLCDPGLQAGDDIRELGTSGHWALASKYYIVRRVNEWGEPLARPQVTLFTVRGTGGLEAPGVDVRVAGDGSLDFSWSPVEGATSYSVVMVTRPRDRESLGRAGVSYTILGDTTATTLNSADASKERGYAEYRESTGQGPYEQNANLATAIAYSAAGANRFQTEDEAFRSEAELGLSEHAAYVPAENGFPIVTFGVIASNDTESSSLREVDGESLMAQVPVEIPEFGNQQYEDQHPCADQGECAKVRTAMPVTMLDGRTSMRPRIMDAEQTLPCNSWEDPEQASCLKVISRVQGTSFFEYDEFPMGSLDQAARDAIAAQNESNLKAMPRTGLSGATFSYTISGVQVDPDERVATTMPEVDYPVNGSIELVKFMAANLMAGNYRMDVTRYVQDPSVDLDDAIAEALSQNPYTLGTGGFGVSTDQVVGHTVVEFAASLPGDAELERLAGLRDQMLAKATDVVGSIITPGMSDTAKAEAINAWLVDNGAYDYDAWALKKAVDAASDTDDMAGFVAKSAELRESYPNAWNAAGILLYGRGVCVSYAAAFKVLADQAGLPAVYVTGVATEAGEGHAWVKAQLDGEWRVIDPTWDDGDDPSAYFGLADKDGEHAQDSDWMMDPFIQVYTAA